MKIGIGLSTVVALLLFFGILPGGCSVRQVSPPYSEPIYGMWIWHPNYVHDQVEQDRLIDFCLKQGMNRLLVQIHFDPGSVQRGQPQLMYPEQMRRLLIKASRMGITIEALDGEPSMARASNHARAYKMLDAILAFNRTLPVNARFVGVHYDIEPYTLDQWNTPERQSIMREYVEFHTTVRDKLHRESPPMLLAASIPFWYDLKASGDDHCVLAFRGLEKNFHEHIQDATDYVAIMSYRREAEGEDSITAHVASEVRYAQKIGRYVCAGIETIQLDETPDITFYGSSPTEFRYQQRRVQEILSPQQGFGGIMIHDYKGLSQLLSPTLTRTE